MDAASRIASDVTVYSKYAKYLPDLKRRETWDELVSRYEAMLGKKYPHELKTIQEACNAVRRKEILPSMRAAQFAGTPIERNNSRIYNCAFMQASYAGFFRETMFLLLGGTGVGYSVQDRHISQLPTITVPGKEKRFNVGDSIEGWADAVDALFRAFFKGKANPRFDFSDVRAKGMRLITAGGKAPGPGPLRVCLDKIRGLLETKPQGSQLTSVEVSDLACFIADAVLSGGIRRAAMICLFDIDDAHMLAYKKGAWYELSPERARVNVSAVAFRQDEGDYDDTDTMYRVWWKATTEEQFKAFWKATEESKSGEPGIYWTNHPDHGTNPCMPAWALVLTPDGISELGALKAGDKIWSKEGWTTVVKKWSTGVKPVFKYKTSAGVFYGTENHRVVSDGEKVEARHASSIDIVRGCGSDFPAREQDVMDGLVLGDGTVHAASNNLVYLCVGGGDSDYFESEIANLILKARPGLGDFAHEVTTTICANELPKTYLRQIPSRFMRDIRSYKGILRGLFSANGSVCGNRVTLKATSLVMVEQAQAMLNAIGIKSYITSNESKDVKFKNGTYTCKESYDLNIAADRALFVEKIGFIQRYKNDKLWVSGKPTKPEKVSYEIQSLEFVREEEVFDITVDNSSHTFWTQGCDVSNCCEIALRHKQFCNLTTINFSTVQSQSELNTRSRLASVLGTLQAGFVDMHFIKDEWENNCREEALLGVSFTGIGDNADYANYNFSEAAQEAVKANEELSKRIGTNKAARVTCIKPEGTASLVLGCASGVHGRHSPFYIRRFRFKRVETVAQYFAQQIPSLVVEDKFDPDGVILELPQRSPLTSIGRTEAALETLERLKFFRTNWVEPGHISGVNTHNVSCTVSVRDNEWDTVGQWMWNNRAFYNGIAVLPFDGHSYVQAPFEDCDEETFNRMFEKLKEVDLSQVNEDEDHTTQAENLACSGGSCEI